MEDDNRKQNHSTSITFLHLQKPNKIMHHRNTNTLTEQKNKNQVLAPCVFVSVSRVVGRRIRGGGVLRVGRLWLTVVARTIVGVPWLSGRDGRRVDRVGESPGLLRRITWLVVTSITSTSLLDGGESDWRRLGLGVVFITTRSHQFILGSFTHTTNAAEATEN